MPETPTNTEKKVLPPYKKADYRIFVKFYALPTIFKGKEYGFTTEKEFSIHYKLSNDTLTAWKKRPEFDLDVDNQLKKWGADQTPEVINALLDNILADGKAPEVKLWLQFMKNWKEGMILEQPSIERANKLSELLQNATPEVKQQFNNILKKLLPDKREGSEKPPISK